MNADELKELCRLLSVWKEEHKAEDASYCAGEVMESVSLDISIAEKDGES